MIEKISYERRVYESVDDNSLSKAISQKIDEKNKSCNRRFTTFNSRYIPTEKEVPGLNKPIVQICVEKCRTSTGYECAMIVISNMRGSVTS